jgi:hypothetical protein
MMLSEINPKFWQNPKEILYRARKNLIFWAKKGENMPRKPQNVNHYVNPSIRKFIWNKKKYSYGDQENGILAPKEL